MEVLTPTVTLNNGLVIPHMGCGPSSPTGVHHVRLFGDSFLGRNANSLVKRVKKMKHKNDWIKKLSYQINIGYRLIDFSIAYGGMAHIKTAIERSNVSADKVFIASRFSNTNQLRANLHEVFKKAKKQIGGRPIDLFGFHWPVTGHYIETYKFLEQLYKDGEIRAIAICNCHQHHLERILDECDIVPAINQFEVHPLFTQKPLIKFCQSHNIQVEAYTPLARNDERLRKARALTDAAKRHHKTLAQIILRWEIQLGLIPIPRSSNYDRLKQNISLFDFELSEEEMLAIDKININSRLRYDPDNCDFTQL